MNDEKKYEKTLYIALIVLFSPLLLYVFWMFYNAFWGKSGEELFLERKAQLEFKGKVIEEYRERDNHNIKVEVLNDGYEYQVIPEWERLIKVGDSISKKKDSLYVILIKAETGEKIKLDYEKAVKGWR
jgi:uncharacterized membrane protein